MKSACAVVGGQFGSEGKGAIVAHIAQDYDVHVRVGAANAGHTFYTNDGIGWDDPNSWQKHVMQQLPCAAYANPAAPMMIGPGALISREVLSREITDLWLWKKERGMVWHPVYIDYRAHMISDRQIDRESETDLARRIGSTSAIAREGIGVAQADRALRSESCVLAGGYFTDGAHHVREGWIRVINVPEELASSNFAKVLLEGTQGVGLSLTTGHFPYVTSRNTTVAGLCADCGVAPSKVDRVILVVRTHPIRVAGNSGPFALGSEEISWADIGVDPEEQRTTVTKKIRRVATFSMDQVIEACYLNGATEIALMFCDQLDDEIKGMTQVEALDMRHTPHTWSRMTAIEVQTGVPVRYLGTGPRTIIDLGARA